MNHHKSYIDHIIGDTKHHIIVEEIISLADKLGLKTVAEGIEDEKQYEILSQLGCNLGQGYFMSKPLSLEDFLNRIKED